MKVVTPILLRLAGARKRLGQLACVLTVTPFSPQPSATFA